MSMDPCIETLGMPGEPVSSSSVSGELWRCSKDVAFEALHSSFVVALAQGTLARYAYQHYIMQDAQFLIAFAKSYSLALGKCGPGSTASDQSGLKLLHQGVQNEMQLHASYAARWGVDMRSLGQATSSCSPATLAYTDFLMEVAQDPTTSLAEILAAMAPCSRLYGWLGVQLARVIQPRHAYMEWIETYSADSYLALPILKESLLDAAVAAEGTDIGKLHRLYRRAMQLEVAFFSAQPAVPLARPVKLLVVDFDDTCTSKDTITLLLNAAAKAQARAATSPEAAKQVQEQAEARSAQLSASYMAQQADLLQVILPQEAEPHSHTVAPNGDSGVSHMQPLDTAGLGLFLDQLSDFDMRMNKVVVDSGALKGLTPEDVVAAGALAQLRPGSRAVLERALAAGIHTHVLSVNWSTHLIQAALGLPQLRPGMPEGYVAAASSSVAPLLADLTTEPASAPLLHPGAPPGSEAEVLVPLSPLIVANELEQATPGGGCTGRMQARVQCARDKGWAFASLMQGAGVGPRRSGGEGASVYVGDSVSDLAALLQADYGLIVGSSKLLRRVCKHYGVALRPLIAAPLTLPAPRGVLYEASGFDEIEAFVFGPRSYEAEPYKGQMDQVRASWASQNNTAASTSHPAPRTPPRTPQSVQSQFGTASGSGHASHLPASAPSSATPGAPAPTVPVVLTIAGSDSGGGAGIQADLKAFQACGVFGTSAVTAITAQNTWGVQAVHAVPLDVLAAQVDSVLSDMGAGAVKTGMLPSADAVKLVADKLRAASVVHLVVDPVMVSTSGHSLVGGGVAGALAQHLLPLATLVTPNIPEAEALLGCAPILSVADQVAAARELCARGICQAVLLKGGHLVKPQGQVTGTQVVTDVFFDGHELHTLEMPVVYTGNTHGTGCTLASAIAAHLARGLPLLSAVQAGRDYLHACLTHSALLAIGTGASRPFNHGWAVADWQEAAQHSSPTDATLAQPHNGLGSRRWDPAAVAQAMRVYVITESRLNEAHGRSMGEAVAAAVAGGATIVQVREKDCDGGLFYSRAQEALTACRAAGVTLVINDRIDVALALGPDVGVHVGQGDMPVHLVRKLLGPGRLLGVSCKCVAHVELAAAQGADYAGTGAVFPTKTKDSPVLGVEGLATVCRAATIPVVAIGGVGASTARQLVLEAGAAGVAVVTGVFNQPDIKAATQALRQVVDEALLERARAGDAPQ